MSLPGRPVTRAAFLLSGTPLARFLHSLRTRLRTVCQRLRALLELHDMVFVGHDPSPGPVIHAFA